MEGRWRLKCVPPGKRLMCADIGGLAIDTAGCQCGREVAPEVRAAWQAPEVRGHWRANDRYGLPMWKGGVRRRAYRPTSARLLGEENAGECAATSHHPSGYLLTPVRVPLLPCKYRARRRPMRGSTVCFAAERAARREETEEAGAEQPG